MGFCCYFEHFSELTQLLRKIKHNSTKFILFIFLGKLIIKQNRQFALLRVGPYIKLSKDFLCIVRKL